MSNPPAHCMGCKAPIQFQPGAGSRLCPFCGYINLVREQRLAVPPLELRTDEVFDGLQRGKLAKTIEEADKILDPQDQGVRLTFYRACALYGLGKIDDAIYTLIDLTGQEAPLALRADTHSYLARALLAAGRTEEAMESARKALRLLEDHPDAQYTRAKILIEQDRTPEAAIILEEILPSLSQRWKVTFPPRPSTLLLQLAHIYVADQKFDQATVALEKLLLQDTAASLPMVAEAIGLLGGLYLDVRLNQEEGLSLIRQAALLDPDDERGQITALKETIRKTEGDLKEELQSLGQRRGEVLEDFKNVFRLVEGFPLDPAQLSPTTRLDQIYADADIRTDIMQRAANRLGIMHFDRGTLYPLHTVDDFCRWLISWKARDYIKRQKHDELESERLSKLKAAHEVQQTHGTFHRQKERVQSQRQQHRNKRRGRRTIIVFALLLLAVAIVIGFQTGDRLLDQFSGRLTKITCLGHDQGPPCTLYIATGTSGRARYQNRQSEELSIENLLSQWLDRRIQKTGVIRYPLGLPWGDIPVAAYRACLGKQVRKERFSFRPICLLEDKKK